MSHTMHACLFLLLLRMFRCRCSFFIRGFAAPFMLFACMHAWWWWSSHHHKRWEKKVHTQVSCGRQAIHNPISSNIAFSSYAQIAKRTFSQQLVCPRQRHVFEQQYKRSWKDDGVLWCSVHITYTIHLNKAKKMFTGCVRVYDGRFYIYSFLDLTVD